MPSKGKAAKPQKQSKAAAAVEKLTSTSKVPSAKVTAKVAKSSKPALKSKDVETPQDDDSEHDEASVDEPESDEENGSDAEDAGESSEDEDEDDDVDEEGMEKLMKLLGEDGLDDFAKAELEALAAEGEESEDDLEVDGEDAAEEKDEDADAAEEDEDEEVSDEEAELAEEEGVLLEDADSVDEDAVPKQKVEIDNKIALERIRDTIKLDPSIPWTEVLTVTYPETIDVDVDDDLNRELAFYKQALHGAQQAKELASKNGLPFTRPADYFAEMVKTDAHMERIRQRLLDESATIKRSEEKRKEREGKKFGKQVQLEKQKERERSKKDMEERLKGLKRKRKGALDNDGDDEAFDVAVEDAIADRPSKRGRTDRGRGKKNLSRTARDQKFGFGGAGRRSKQNTKSSTDDFGGRGDRPARGGRGGRGGARGGGAKRLGKSRRMDARSRA